MKPKNKLPVSSLVVLILLMGPLPSLIGCAGKRVASGDVILLDYTCRTPDGAIATTTKKRVAEDPDLRKTSFFQPLAKPGGVRMFPGQKLAERSKRNLKLFEPEVRARLSDAVLGLPYDKPSTVTIASTESKTLEGENRFLYIDRIRIRPLRQTVPRKNYVRGQGSEPVVGDILSKDGMDYGKVVVVDDENVTFEILADPLLEVDTPWGKATATRKGDEVVTVIEATVGSIVRTGSVLGRISEVGDKRIVVDYGHPFAYQDLSCEVLPRHIEEDKQPYAKRADANE